ncbi:MAG TPA: hypothetical protein VFZ42_00925 [Chitinophagaceae bacterium]
MNNTLIQFTLLVPVNSRLREFNFRKRSEERYDCNTADERGERYYFQLIRNNDQWVIEDAQLPAWLIGHKDAIARALAEREARGI